VKARLSILLAATALVLAGCGGGEATTTGPTQGTEEQKRASGSTGATPQRPHAQPQEGSKAAAPGVPTSPHGDNSIQTYGLEASGAERERVSALVRSYLDARVAGDWAAVCALLAAKARAEQSRFGGGASCAKAMRSFAAEASPGVLAEEAEIEVLSLRQGTRYAFLIYRRPDGIFAIPLTREGGGWRLVLVTPTPVG
jgi:hypothetical protein